MDSGDITGDLIVEIKSRYPSFKLKSIRKGWLAQVRPRNDGVADIFEISAIGRGHLDALNKLKEKIREAGIHD